MKKRFAGFFALVLVLASVPGFSQSSHRSGGHQGRSNPSKPVQDVAKDLPERLARWKTVQMPFHSQGLKPREIQLVNKQIGRAHV